MHCSVKLTLGAEKLPCVLAVPYYRTGALYLGSGQDFLAYPHLASA